MSAGRRWWWLEVVPVPAPMPIVPGPVAAVPPDLVAALAEEVAGRQVVDLTPLAPDDDPVSPDGLAALPRRSIGPGPADCELHGEEPGLVPSITTWFRFMPRMYTPFVCTSRPAPDSSAERDARRCSRRAGGSRRGRSGPSRRAWPRRRRSGSSRSCPSLPRKPPTRRTRAAAGAAPKQRTATNPSVSAQTRAFRLPLLHPAGSMRTPEPSAPPNASLAERGVDLAGGALAGADRAVHVADPPRRQLGGGEVNAPTGWPATWPMLVRTPGGL